MKSIRLLTAAFIVLLLFVPARAEQPAQLSGIEAVSHEDAARHLVRTYNVKLGINSVAFLPGGSSAVIAGIGDNIVLDLSTGREILKFPGGKESLVRSVAVSRDGRYAVAGRLYTLELWDLVSGRTLRVMKGHSGFVDATAISPDGRYALSGGDDGRVRLWEMQSGRPVRDLRGPGQGMLRLGIKAVAILPGGRFVLAGGGMDVPLQLWDLQSGKEIVRFEKDELIGPNASSIAVFPNGRMAISAGSDQILYLWDLRSGRQLRKIKGHAGFIGAVAVSPDGRFAASAGSALTSAGTRDAKVSIKLWSTSDWKEVHEFEGGLQRIDSIAFSPDGRFILSGGMGDKLRLWDAGPWTKLKN